MDRTQQNVTVINKEEVFSSSYTKRNSTFRVWLMAQVHTFFDNRYRTFIIEQTDLDESKTLYQLNP